MQDQILGDYKILKQIGQGSLGTVYLAEHRFIKKPYILKVLPEELGQDRAFISRFEEEVGRITSLDHPHIVKIHTVSFAQGSYFLVTDCIVDSIGETTNLAQYMLGRKGRLKEEELCHLLGQVADAIDYAHEKEGIAHRSLKLNNILIGKAKPGIEVFLSDFGLSKIVGMGAVLSRCYKALAEALLGQSQESVSRGEERYFPFPIESHKLSKLSQSFLQTYAFLAPEQKRLEPVDFPVDIYAFGVLTYYLITGIFPEGIFPSPSERAPEYSYNWDALVNACLAYDPAIRPKRLRPLLDSLSQGHTIVERPKLRPVVVEPREAPALPPVVEVVIPKKEEPAPVLVATAFAPTPEENSVAAQLVRDPVVVKEYHPEKKETRPIEPILTEMAVIPGGKVIRGSKDGNRDEMPQHAVYLESFAIDIHPVTNEQFVRFLEYTGGEKDQNYNDLIRLKDSRLNRVAGKLSIESGYSKHPVVGVTWYGAVAYAKWVGKRLPTEAEWEAAARGGKEFAIYPTGDTIEKSQANFFSSDTTAVMSYAPNGYGLYDMAGNVYDWCQDWYGYNYYESSALEPHNPKGPLQGVYRVLRGGCWKSLKEDLRCSHRHRNNPGAMNGTYGFRCASDSH